MNSGVWQEVKLRSTVGETMLMLPGMILGHLSVSRHTCVYTAHFPLPHLGVPSIMFIVLKGTLCCHDSYESKSLDGAWHRGNASDGWGWLNVFVDQKLMLHLLIAEMKLWGWRWVLGREVQVKG